MCEEGHINNEILENNKRYGNRPIKLNNSIKLNKMELTLHFGCSYTKMEINSKQERMDLVS